MKITKKYIKQYFAKLEYEDFDRWMYLQENYNSLLSPKDKVRAVDILKELYPKIKVKERDGDLMIYIPKNAIPKEHLISILEERIDILEAELDY